ncbi:hybrid sensor histidine kinase/response regulator [Mastigocladopsis repens]|uniref:hybrid sensor histidine kinase/response regulator n=1 Tax=Mastigocladopsis repens TaxID=221287 RepID=UPI0002E367F9|nr:PAS domain S-box protein [Mastigocladopsis repens]
MNPLLSNNEVARLEALHQYQILDTSPEQTFDDLAFLAAQICATPIALINLIDANRQWFKAKVGLDIEEMPVDIGLCPLCIQQRDVLIIPDTLADERFATSPVVTSAPYVRFYAGVPLITPEGHVIGTVCVVDRVPRLLQPEQLESLKAISRLVMRQLELRRNLTQVASIKTEYQQAQEALRQSESTLRSFFDSAPMMMGIVELLDDNDILHISDNAATAKFFGLAPGAMGNRLASELGLSPDYVRDWIDYFRQAQSLQLPVSFEHPHNVLGDHRWLRATVSVIGESSLSHPRFAYIVEDITERQQAEEELRWKEALLRSMTGVSPLAFYVVDHRTSDILYVNERFCEIWGIQYLKEQIESGRLKHQDVMNKCCEFTEVSPFISCEPIPSQTCICEDEILLNDGRTIRRFSRRIQDENDQYFARLYIFEDITVRKLAEQHVREQAALLDIATDAIIVRDLNNKILLWNKSAENLYGWKAQETLGRNAEEILYNNKLLPQHREIYQNVFDSGSWQGELQKMTKSGKEIIVESRWTLVRDEHFQPKSILVVETDITEKKQLEKQFLRNQRMESIGTLASGIAHDLNNVLSPILMSVQMLKVKSQDERSRKILTIVENNAKRGANLVKQVLSFARGIEGDGSANVFGERTGIQLKNLISEMKQIVEQTFPKSIAIQTEIQPDLLAVCGDSTQLHQVLMNLCLNARDAMTNGGNLKISAQNVFIDENFAKMHLDAQAGSYIVLTVADTGIGISNELLDRIFEPFFTTKEFGKGTGLGLSTVMGIIKGHGGFVTVSSSIGKGTKFKVYLPAVKTAATQLIEDLEMPTGYGEWILVVDDEPAIREITKASLENNNYKVMTASDGIEAVALYAQYKDKISAAIVDMMMPNMDGVTTINTLHKMNPLLRVIAVSGLATSEQVPLDKASKLTAFLPKPYTAQELLKTLHSVISGY